MLKRRERHLNTVDSEDLEARIIEWGVSLVGFGDVSIGLAPELKHMPTAISLAVKHPVGRGTYKCGSMTAYSNQYEEVDQILDSVQKKVTAYLKALGWRSLAIPPDSAKVYNNFISKLYPLFPHKTAATCAGLGWIGKSGLLVNPMFGGRLSWATVLTDAPLSVCRTPYTESKCGNCARCVNACPATAIGNANWKRGEKYQPFIDIDACAEYMSYTVRVFSKYICGLCVLACPLGGRKT